MSITVANQFYGSMDHGGDLVNPSPMVSSPRLKFKYTATFEGFESVNVPFPLKSVTIPDISFETKVVQQYNIKRVVQQKINYGQATMTLVDTFDNRFTDNIYIPYVSNYYNNGKGISLPNTSIQPSQKSPVIGDFSTTLGYTAPSNTNRFNIPSIKIALDGGPNPKVYTLHNCFFVTINNDTLDYEQSQPVMYTLTIQPELITISTPFSDTVSDGTQEEPQEPFILIPAPFVNDENTFLESLQTTTTTPTLLDVVESQLDQANINFNIA
jgi:hypothetical protein